MKRKILISLSLLSLISALNAQIYTPSGIIQGPSNNNNVGIGIAPIYKLHSVSYNNTANTSAFLWGQYYGAYIGIQSNDPTYYAFNVSNGVTENGAGGTSLFMVRGDGNVGIGTYPTHKLQVNGNGNFIAQSKNSAPLSIKSSSGVDYAMYFYEEPDGDYLLRLKNSAGVDAVGLSAGGYTFFNGGNVGIGTSTPNRLLEIGSVGTSIPSFIKAASDNGIGAANGNKLIYLFNNGTSIKLDAYDYGTSTPLPITIGGNGGNIILNGGSVGINTISPDSRFKLDVEGTIRASEVKVCLQGGCDFVFKSDYKLMDLKSLETFVKTKQHLPEIAPEKEMVENGMNMKEMQMKLLQKIEELTLYTIEQNKKLEQQNEKIMALENEMKEMKKK